MTESEKPPPNYIDWSKLPPDEQARKLVETGRVDADLEGLIANILEHFKPDE